MLNENFATRKSATRNSAIYKTSVVWKKYKMEIAISRKCSMKKYTLSQWNMEKVLKNSAV